MNDETGSMLPAFGGLLFVSFVLLTLTVEIGLLGAAYRETADIADIAAEVGAAMIDASSIHGGLTKLEVSGAASEAASSLSLSGVTPSEANVQVAETSVCVSISRQHQIHALGYLSITNVQVQVTGCAEPATG